MTKEVISKYVIKKNTKMADAMKKIDDNSCFKFHASHHPVISLQNYSIKKQGAILNFL